jgi:peptidoglycan/xylan/chitin deacetylase (PgdA/CDA1 family)
MPLSGPGGSAITVTPGRVTVISFVAFWCDTWKEQSRRLIAAQTAMDGLPIQWITVSVDGRWAERGKGEVCGEFAMDPGGAIASGLEIHAIPYTLILDKLGVVQYAAQGIVRADAVRPLIAAALEETQRPAGDVYLTFDDFPSGDRDDALLDALAKAGVHATFFCIGRKVEAYPAIVRRAADGGNALGLHSWDHSAERPQLARCRDAVLKAAGRVTDYYRAPGSEKVIHSSALDHSPLPRLTVNPYDYARPGTEEIVRRVLLAAKPGCVVLLHAGVSQTVEALPAIIAGLRERGFDCPPLP